MNILLTGGAGYIGSHTAVSIVEAGHQVIIYDNFCNSSRGVLSQLKKILHKSVICVEGDVRDRIKVESILKEYEIEVVMHFAGLKAVDESFKDPLAYYDNNVLGSISLIGAMDALGIRKLIFSSSATVYGAPVSLPIDEYHQLCPTNPYGQTKLDIEIMLKQLAQSNKAWHVMCMRYFNPVGAHDSGLIGEAPGALPNNLMPYLALVASGELPKLCIHGDDYPTLDGSGVRDYIHVMDLASGHLAALNYLNGTPGFHAFNLGTGNGYSVFNILKAYENTSGKIIPYEIGPRRSGDVSSAYADVSCAKNVLGWSAQRGLTEMCESSWRWQTSRLKPR